MTSIRGRLPLRGPARSPMLVTLGLLAHGLLVLAQAGPAAAADDGTAICRSIADRYRAALKADPKASHPDSFYAVSPLDTLANLSGGGVVLADPVAKLSGEATASFKAWAKQAGFTPSPDVLKEIDSLGEEGATIDHLPGSDYYAVGTFAGTLGCYEAAYFRAEKNGRAERAEAPEGPVDDEPGGGCGISRSTFGTIDKTAVALQETFSATPARPTELAVTPWQGDKFGKTCTIAIDYAPRFDAHGTFNKWDEKCTGADCDGLRQAALALVETVQKAPADAQKAETARLSAAQQKDFAAMLTLAGPVPPSDEPPADQVDPAAALTETSPALLPLVHEGKLYLASAGHFTIGWRVFSDWSVKLQVLEGGALQDKAVFAIGMTKGEIANISIR